MKPVDESGVSMVERVAVLGGGIAGLTAALELTATPELRRRYEVTLHQLGWRCGGKCATGRNAQRRNRVEEHGLHLWFGGYDNAFRLLGDCYRELDRPTGHPMATMHDAWRPLSSVVLYDDYEGRWSERPMSFDIEPGLPWDDPEVPRFWDLAVSVLHTVDGHAPTMRARSHRDGIGVVDRLLRQAGNAVERLMVAVGGRLLDLHHRAGASRRWHLHSLARLLELIRGAMWRRHVRDHISDDDVRHRWSQTDTMLTCLIGMIRDQVLIRGFDAINDEDFADWLARHGAQPVTLQGPDVRVIYDQCFSANRGPSVTGAGPPPDETKRGFAAGAALYSLIRTRLPYRGSVMWQARAGMGDTAIAPMYEVLAKRGVKVEFFHAVENLGVDAAAGVVDSIDIVEQATPNGGYDPLVDVPVDGGVLRCWPSLPKWDLLRNGDALAASGIDFELGQAQPGAPRHRLRRGEDFDTVVLAISAAALPMICGEVMAADPAFANMLDNTTTIMTQAFQLWLDESPDQLGFGHGHTATSTFIEPLDTGCDNSQVLWSEARDDGGPASVWYFCGDLLDQPGERPEEATERARQGALEYLGELHRQWPGMGTGDGFRWNVLHAPAAAEGQARFDAQYWRANVAPTERYVQTMPGTVRHRLAADESRLTNLVLAGDWIRNGFDIGAVESTVMSGMQAARAISGHPDRIAWDGHRWLIDR